jgi:general secretion pathway protein D
MSSVSISRARSVDQLLRALTLFLTVVLTGAAAGQDAGDEAGVLQSDDGAITLNLRDADIRAFIASVADITGRNFVVDPRVKGNVTVISSAPTTADALYDVFLSILKVHGFAAIPSGDVIKIVPDATAKQEGQSARSALQVGANDALVTAVIPVEHVSAPELVAILRPLLPQEAHLAGFAASNVLVVADSGANVRRLVGIVGQLDTASKRATDLIVLEHADADDVVRVLNSLRGAEGQQPPTPGDPLFIAYGRTNTVIIHAEPRVLPRYRNLVESLDIPDRGPDSVEVVPLRFASAVDLVPVLQSVLTGQTSAALATTGIEGEVAPTGAPGEPTIQADEATNMLIIQAPARELRVLREVIAQLDVRRRQVLVEGIIAELTTQRADELGIQWQTNQPDTGIIAGTQLPGGVSGGIDGAIRDGSLTLLNGLTLGYLRHADIRALLRAISSDRYTNVLSTPTLMTLDNAEAEIVVGQNVPFVTGQFTNDATTPDNPFQTIERQDVGILLRVKPQINDGDTVTLELEQEVPSVDPSTSGVDLITNKRAIKTTVLVDNREIVVLGGLIEDDLSENEQKVPIVGDIPVIGHLFKNTRSDFTKTNLMVFLRPTIIRDRAGNRDTAATRYEGLRARQRAEEPQRSGWLREDAPELPAYDGLLE